MDFHKLMFSEKRSDRLKRHLIFWVTWYFYYAVLHAANPFGAVEISYFRNPVFTFSESFLYIFAQMPLVYIMLYFIFPRFILKRKYVAAVVASVILWFFGGLWHLYLSTELGPKILAFFLPPQFLLHTERLESASFFMAMMAAYKGAFTVSAIAFVIKFAKYWYLKEQRNLQLQKENAESQLQLLTAQVHPHFLFNTLNNIYSQAQNESPKSSKMIMGLSDMLRYIIYEGKKPLVPLKQELQMINEYISLEKIRYGNKLDVHVLIPDNIDNIYIAPLLLLPLIENCFKHGASNILQNPWISLTVEMKRDELVMKLMNAKADAIELPDQSSGIGINNVRKRLELLYQGKYDLQIRSEPEVFVVDLKVQLVRMHETFQDQTKPSILSGIYAE